MKQRRIKLICENCGASLRWCEDKDYRGLIKVEVCPDCCHNLTREQRLKYEQVRKTLDNVSDNLGTTHKDAEGKVVDEGDEELHYSC